nr:hypothetical protein [Tanacetum cinerariifolium]
MLLLLLMDSLLDPNNNNRWIEWDVPLGGELDEPMVDPEV